MKDIKDLSFIEANELFTKYGEQPFRAKELFRAIYKNKIKEFANITTFPIYLRMSLSNDFYIRSFHLASEITSKDGTEKFLFKLRDKSLIETVLIKEKNKNGKARNTACISTQVGCPMRCKFCATGEMGFKRNLTTGEIVEQFLTLEDKLPVQNIVFMGMGEPLINYANTKKAIEIISNSYGRALGRRKITLSTSGIIDKIYRLTDEIKSIKLAVSLHSAIQEKRNFLMPGLKDQPLDALNKALNYYSKKTGNTITIEYLLINDINDTTKDLIELIRFARKIKFVKVNLIHFNTVPFIDFSASKKEENFLSNLLKSGIRATLRKSKGTEISAACGQLATKNNISVNLE